MKKIFLLFFLVVLYALPSSAQINPFPGSNVIHGVDAPINPCNGGTLYTDDSTGNFYTCNAGNWFNIGSASNVIHGTGAPTNPCVAGTLYTDDSTGNFYTCDAGGWVLNVSTNNAFLKPLNATAIQWVTAQGNDLNDGLSFGTSKLTIYAALCSLPSGDCSTQTIGSGTVYFTTGVAANTSVANAGIWIMGPNDPNFGSVPAGWLKTGSGNKGNLNIIGVGNAAGGPNGHKPRINLVSTGKSTDNNFPGLWISSLATNIYIANMQFATIARGIVLGECSNNLRDGTCGVQSIILDNVGSLNAQTATSGPCETIGGNSFWIWHRDFGCTGNYNAPGGVTDDLHAAVLIDASTSPGAGLIYYTDVNFAGGGIKVKSGSSGTQLYVKNAIEEGDFVHGIPPVVWFTSWNSANSDAVLDNIQNADGGAGTMAAIETDVTSNIYGTIQGPTVLNSLIPSGPATNLNPLGNSFVATTNDPFKNGQSGFFNGYVIGRTDVARRIAGLVPLRFTNSGFSSSASWTFTNNGGVRTFTQGVADPFGGIGAASISNSTATANTVTAGQAGYTPATGDWIVGGIWAKGLAQTGDSFVLGCPNQSTISTSYVYKNFGLSKGDGQWQYIWMAEKVVAGGPATAYCDTITFNSALTPTLYGPTLYLIPAGTLSDNEVLNFANTMNSVDSSCAVGSICNVAGHPVSADVFTERATVAPTGTTGITKNYMDSTTNWPSFKPNSNTAYSTAGFLAGAPVDQDCVKWIVSGSVATLGDAGAVCGSGGGGSGTVTSIATTSPLGGGTITTTGTLTCTTCVVASSPGTGIAHFAGSTQTVTSSAVSLTADVSGLLPIANLPFSTAAAGELPNATSSSVAAWTTTPTLGASGTAGTLAMFNNTAKTTWGSGATTSNTILGFPVVPVTGDVVVCTTSSTTCTLTDSGVTTPAASGSGVLAQTIASGTQALGTSAIGSGACATAISIVATGVATTDNILVDFNVDPTGTTGYNPGTGEVQIFKYPTSDHVNIKVCNPTGVSITPSAMTVNWRVVR